jgi:ankyrin repeat protein
MTSLDDLLIFAARSGNDSLVRDRIAAGADVNHAGDQYGSPLLEAIRCGHVTVVETLLAHGADPNRSDHRGQGPLEYALHYGHDQITGILLRVQARLRPHSSDAYRRLLSECLGRLGQQGPSASCG